MARCKCAISDNVEGIYDLFKLASFDLGAVAVHNQPARVRVFLHQLSEFLFANPKNSVRLLQS